MIKLDKFISTSYAKCFQSSLMRLKVEIVSSMSTSHHRDIDINKFTSRITQIEI